MLAYGMCANCIYEYLKIGENTPLQCLKKFVEGVIAVFGGECSRKPTQADVDRLLVVGNELDFPGSWEASIVCIGRGRTVQRLEKQHLLKGSIRFRQSFLRWLCHIICGYAMLSSKYHEV